MCEGVGGMCEGGKVLRWKGYMGYVTSELLIYSARRTSLPKRGWALILSKL